MKLSKEVLKKIIHSVVITQPDEIGCDECYEELDNFAELELMGKSPEEALPLVKDHLDRCSICREEYEALLEAMKNLKA